VLLAKLLDPQSLAPSSVLLADLMDLQSLATSSVLLEELIGDLQSFRVRVEDADTT